MDTQVADYGLHSHVATSLKARNLCKHPMVIGNAEEAQQVGGGTGQTGHRQEVAQEGGGGGVRQGRHGSQQGRGMGGRGKERKGVQGTCQYRMGSINFLASAT